MLGYYYVFMDGPVLNTDMEAIPDGVAIQFADDLQGRLLSQAGSVWSPVKEVTVMLVSNVALRPRMVNHSGMSHFEQEVYKTAQSQEILLGRVIRTADTRTCNHLDGSSHSATMYHEPFEMIRADVPENVCKKVLKLPSF